MLYVSKYNMFILFEIKNLQPWNILIQIFKTFNSEYKVKLSLDIYLSKKI